MSAFRWLILISWLSISWSCGDSKKTSVDAASIADVSGLGGRDGRASSGSDLTIKPGTYTGEVSFNVGSDGASLTVMGTTLKGGASLAIDEFFCDSTRLQLSVTDTVPIVRNSFTYKSTSIEVTGKFVSAAAASGTYTLTPGIPLCGSSAPSKSGNWAAGWWRAPADAGVGEATADPTSQPDADRVGLDPGAI